MLMVAESSFGRVSAWSGLQARPKADLYTSELVSEVVKEVMEGDLPKF